MKPSVAPKFSTEGELIVPSVHFEKFKAAINSLADIVSKRVYAHESSEGIYNGHSLELLNYEGEPEQLYFSRGLSAKEFKCDWNFLNREMIISDNLALVRNRQKRTSASMFMHSPKYEYYQYIPMPEGFTCVKSAPKLDNLVFVIKVYLPFFKKCRSSKIKIMQEIHMLGRQTLRDLLSTIQCNVDYCGLEDVSDRIGKEAFGGTTNVRKELFPSSFIYINKTFYRPLRFTDVTKEVKEWLAQNNIEYTETANLEVTLQDLQLQIGRPYLYQHQGECEHVVIISDIRFGSNVDFLIKSMYPHVAAISGVLARHCMLCGNCSARWLVTNFLKLTIARAFLCHRCLLSYCYIDGRKAGDFQVYQYVDPVAIL